MQLSIGLRYKKSSQVPRQMPEVLYIYIYTYIHVFQESEMAYVFQCEFGNSLRLQMSPELNIIF